MAEEEQQPVFADALFRQKRKGGKWRVMPSPVLEGPVADTHAHLQMLADPACELARAGAHGVALVEDHACHAAGLAKSQLHLTDIHVSIQAQPIVIAAVAHQPDE